MYFVIRDNTNTIQSVLYTCVHGPSPLQMSLSCGTVSSVMRTDLNFCIMFVVLCLCKCLTLQVLMLMYANTHACVSACTMYCAVRAHFISRCVRDQLLSNEFADNLKLLQVRMYLWPETHWSKQSSDMSDATNVSRCMTIYATRNCLVYAVKVVRRAILKYLELLLLLQRLLMLNDISFPVPLRTTCIELSAIYVCTTDQFCNDPLAIASPVELIPHIECCIAAVALQAGVMHLLPQHLSTLSYTNCN